MTSRYVAVLTTVALAIVVAITTIGSSEEPRSSSTIFAQGLSVSAVIMSGEEWAEREISKKDDLTALEVEQIRTSHEDHLYATVAISGTQRPLRGICEMRSLSWEEQKKKMFFRYKDNFSLASEDSEVKPLLYAVEQAVGGQDHYVFTLVFPNDGTKDTEYNYLSFFDEELLSTPITIEII